MSGEEIAHSLGRLVQLGGIRKELKYAKATLHNTEIAAGVLPSGQGDAMDHVELRITSVEDQIRDVQEAVQEAFREAEEGHLIAAGTLAASNLEPTAGGPPFSAGRPVSITALKVGDVVDIKPCRDNGPLSNGVWGARVTEMPGTGYPSIIHAGNPSVALPSDEVYLVDRPSERLPAEMGSWIEVTDYDGIADVPFHAQLTISGWRRVVEGGWLLSMDPENVVAFHELELTRKEAT